MDDAGPVLLRMEGISKRYGGVRALEKADLSVAAGSIHALLGETAPANRRSLRSSPAWWRRTRARSGWTDVP